MTIYLLRHGETEWNTEGRKQGRCNSPLTSLGKSQAIDCANILNSHIDDKYGLIISPLGRAQETAKIISDTLNIQPRYTITAQEIAEHDFGIWRGLTDDEIDQKYPIERKRRSKDKWNYQIPEGESYSMVKQRIAEWFLHQDLSHSIIVAHEMVNRVILGTYLGLNEAETLELSHPHGTIYKLKDKTLTTLA